VARQLVRRRDWTKLASRQIRSVCLCLTGKQQVDKTIAVESMICYTAPFADLLFSEQFTNIDGLLILDAIPDHSLCTGNVS